MATKFPRIITDEFVINWKLLNIVDKLGLVIELLSTIETEEAPYKLADKLAHLNIIIEALYKSCHKCNNCRWSYEFLKFYKNISQFRE